MFDQWLVDLASRRQAGRMGDSHGVDWPLSEQLGELAYYYPELCWRA